jgi:hypothetical protein
MSRPLPSVSCVSFIFCGNYRENRRKMSRARSKRTACSRPIAHCRPVTRRPCRCLWIGMSCGIPAHVARAGWLVNCVSNWAWINSGPPNSPPPAKAPTGRGGARFPPPTGSLRRVANGAVIASGLSAARWLICSDPRFTAADLSFRGRPGGGAHFRVFSRVLSASHTAAAPERAGTGTYT